MAEKFVIPDNIDPIDRWWWEEMKRVVEALNEPPRFLTGTSTNTFYLCAGCGGYHPSPAEYDSPPCGLNDPPHKGDQDDDLNHE
jgi:hypothetical protein